MILSTKMSIVLIIKSIIKAINDAIPEIALMMLYQK